MAKNTENKAKKRNRRTLAYALMILAVFSVFAAGGAYAKYTMGNQADGYITSPNFYFTSDLLQETAVKYTLNPGAEGTAEMTFQVRNFADNLRISDEKIDFKVSVFPADGVTVKVNGSSANGGSLPAKVGTSAKVTVSGLKNGKTYDISVTGTAGFSTTLRAKVTVKPDEQEIYMHINEDDAHYVLLTVWTKNLSGEVRVCTPAGLIPDNTDSAMAEVSNFVDGKYKEITFEDATSFAEKYSSHVYRFFKTSDYESGAFTVTLGGKEATTATLE